MFERGGMSVVFQGESESEKERERDSVCIVWCDRKNEMRTRE